MRRQLGYILLVLSLLVFTLWSCEDDGYISSDDAQLTFSTDTLMFDTIFTTIGSTTKSFRVINPHNQAILISTIALAGGDESAYRLNIDGEMANEMYDIELAANDSLYIFVELTVDPNGSNQPMIVQDSVIFISNTNKQDIDLMAWGQDFVPIDGEILNTTTWTAEKPYLVHNVAWVDSGQVLSIEPGARIFFHKGAALAVLGSVRAIGTNSDPIIFSGDRLEAMYDDIPDQWHGLLLFPNEMENVFENVEIKNAKIGLQVGTIEYEGPAYARLHNVKIEHMSYAGIFAIKSQIIASNTLVSDCGFYGVTLLAGGNYSFNHCTIANYWGSYSNRQTPSLAISNRLIVTEGNDSIEYTGDLVQASWTNSIIWGNLESEVEFGMNSNYLFNHQFDHCIVRMSDSIFTAHSEQMNAVQNNIDPEFMLPAEYNFELDTLSPAKDAGSIQFGELVPLDLINQARLNDEAPDLGVYERIEKEEED
ncbi:hypothetical protein [Roseimarinus sediminis]|uniref:hypothetical protein n=1 Tax=Roseimarinus sediminis TaxID=1610899 RepID=UPI003D1BE2B2